MEIQGEVAVVTGAGSGIGRALATALASAGTHVVVGDIDGGAAEQTVGVISERGHRAVALAGDAGADADIAALIELAAAEFGPVDIYVANAGIGGPPGLVIPEREWDRALDVNLRAHIRAARQLVPAWVDRGGGYFVSVASAAGLLTQLGAAAYAVTKHAAVGFAEWLAITYGDVGIGVSCLCPMGVDTPLLTELRESPEPDARLAANSVVTAGEVLGPDQVAAATLDAMRENRFLVLPHPQVLDMYRQKGADYDGWIAGMRRYRNRLAADG
ncbi:MAG TPA: SDR family oxidoreductase [Mycobacterium sp.]|nr:SDR family oxidoreductase [Mycobacterium sp.]